MGKLIVISAPSGAGKTSIINFLLKEIEQLSFSVSACSRPKRENEEEGKDYHFLGIEGFKSKISEDAFLEWEEVYENQYYGTLRSELKRIWKKEKVAIFDLDVVGGLNLKKKYPSESLAIFIMPPSIKVLEDRLEKRGSESKDSFQKRVTKAKEEIERSTRFDKVILNDNFDLACKQAKGLIQRFIA